MKSRWKGKTQNPAETEQSRADATFPAAVAAAVAAVCSDALSLFVFDTIDGT
jgi:hypothetical protein